MTLLDQYDSLCEKNQKIIISRDKGTSTRKHRADNSEHRYDVRQYKLDGVVVKNETCCDFLLLNDSLRRAYLIELKGRNIDEAVPQLQAGKRILSPELKGYDFYYRIVCSKVNKNDLMKNTFRKFQDACGSRLDYDSVYMEEKL